MSDPARRDLDPSDRVSDERERARALAAVLRDQADRAAASVETVRLKRQRTRLRRGGMALAWIGILYVWVGSPDWLEAPRPPLPTARQEADALRVHVFLQTQRIEAFRRERGRLPYVLAEAGPPFLGVEYRRRDNRSYELTAGADGTLVRYRSDESPLEFVGRAADVLVTAGGAAPPRSRGARP